MILNSGQHTQPDPQSCRVRSLGGRRGGSPKTNNASRDQNKTEQRKPGITHCHSRKPATTTPKHSKQHDVAKLANASIAIFWYLKLRHFSQKHFIFGAVNNWLFGLQKGHLRMQSHFRFGQGHLNFNSTDQKRARQIHALEQSCFWGCDMTLGTHPAASKVRQKT